MSNEDIIIKIEENNQVLKNYIDKYEKYMPANDKVSNFEKDNIKAQNNSSNSESSSNSEQTGNNSKDSSNSYNTNNIVNPSKTNNSSNTSSSTSKNYDKKDSSVDISKQKSEDEIISNYVSTMYSLKNEFVTKLKELEIIVKKEYYELPEDKRNVENKKNLALKYFYYVSNLEKTCDKKVSDNLEELEKELNQIDADTAIVKDIMTIYENEKALQKAYYLSLLKK